MHVVWMRLGSVGFGMVRFGTVWCGGVRRGTEAAGGSGKVGVWWGLVWSGRVGHERGSSSNLQDEGAQ
jgi:hypothetical protein